MTTITLATTTSTRDSGLLDALVPIFEKQSGVRVKVVAVGTGKALAMGRRCDADVLLTHAPQAEHEFMNEGHGISRRHVFFNDFVVVGPPDDPANVRGASTAAAAFASIRDHDARFVSRGDASGTHIKEQSLWNASSIEPGGDWYIEAGSGMASTLRLANEKRAYTLCDRSTFLAQQTKLDLTVLAEGDAVLRNPYAVIVVQQEPDFERQVRAATGFSQFLSSTDARQVIRHFGKDRYGQPLFFLLDD
ncbi:MAG: substrate-binding domain-containing protein [Pirellulales bacterium]|nr:substrate-binding domain-containing protein [Pirellulales bacterium]